jgi:hypothetical protein
MNGNRGSSRRTKPARRRQRQLAALLDATVTALSRYVVFASIDYPRLLALWVAHCHAIDAARSTPIVHVYSPVPGAGKTTLLEVLVQLLPEGKAMIDIDMSAAALYRTLGVESNGDINGDVVAPHIVLLDEGDGVFRHGSERGEALRPIFNQGYRRGGAVTRCVAPDWETRRFNVFGPKLIAGLDNGAMPSTIVSRRLPIPLQPALPEERIEEYDDLDAAPDLNAIRDGLADTLALVLDTGKLVRTKSPDLNGLSARQREVLAPLIAIADVAGVKWPEWARDAAFDVYEATAVPEAVSSGERLLRDLRTILRGRARMFSDALCAALRGDEEAPYARWNYGEGIKPTDLARQLAPFQIRPKNVRIDGEQRKGYERVQFLDAWKRYCRDSPADALAGSVERPSRPAVPVRERSTARQRDAGTGGTAHRKSKADNPWNSKRRGRP